ncbi:MAG: C25 family cysteine peptidase, partial [bacterium]
LPHPSNTSLLNAQVRVALQGLTYPDAYGQGGYHHVYVSLNDQNSSALEGGSSGASWWVGQTGMILYAQGANGISSGALQHGNNSLSIFCPVDTYAGYNDAVLLNWFEITYQRQLKADANLIEFAPPPGAVDTLVDYRITGFTTSDIDVYKVDQSKIINSEVIPYQESGQTFYKLRFQDRPFANPHYVALTPSAKQQPDSTDLVTPADLYTLLGSGAPVKLLVIANRVFEDHPLLESYLQRRQATLGRTELVFIDDVFDEFSDGIYTPQAIKDLLLVLPTPPEFLLLIGDGSYDTRNLYGYGGNLIPVNYIQTKSYGAVASDFWYSLLTDDLLPDLAVGRIPARDAEELNAYLQKLEEYETNLAAEKWRNTHLFVSGSGNVGGITFWQLSQQIIGQLRDDVFINRLATDPITNPFFGGTAELIESFDDGALIVDYNGHGAGSVWSDNSLFLLQNLPQLSNQGRYPFITNFTCFIGAFDTPQPGTILGEEFILEPQKGAIGVLASTGLGWFINGSWLQERLTSLLYEDTQLRLGELINAAKISYYAYYGLSQTEESFDMMHLLNLMGDPSLRLAFAENGVAPQLTPPFVCAGDTVSVTLPGNFSGFQGVCQFYDENDYPAEELGQTIEIPLSGSPSGLYASAPFPAFSDSTMIASGNCRFNYWQAGSETVYHSSAPFYMLDAFSDSTVVDSLLTNPYPVYVNAILQLKAKILDAQGIASAWAHYRIAMNDDSLIVADDSLQLQPTLATFWYETAAALDLSAFPCTVGDKITTWVRTEDVAGNESISDSTDFYILDNRAYPIWVAGSLRLDARENQAALLINLVNQGALPIDSLDVSFYCLDSAPELIAETIVRNVLPDSSAVAYIYSTLSPGAHLIEARLNENNWLDVAQTTVPYSVSLTAELFSVSAASGTGDTLTLADAFHLYLPPGSLSAPNGVLLFRERHDLSISTSQTGLSFVLRDESGYLPNWGFEFGFLGAAAPLGDSLRLAVDFTLYDSLLAVDDIALHLQNSGQSFWGMLASAAETLSTTPITQLRYWAKASSSGAVTLLQNGDHQGPDIEITVDGQIYTQGGYVPTQPKISALIQDLGGVNTQPGNFWVSVDGVVLDSNQVSVGSMEEGQVFTLSINPIFSVGEHGTSVTARDLSGNLTTASIIFQIAGQFRLDFVGNYPNPFKDKTYFAYRLTEQTTEPVQIQIFTVSGRKIRTLYGDTAQEINYGEIYWDGLDKDGEDIANGAYFYKFIARRGGEKIERIMKMARLR